MQSFSPWPLLIPSQLLWNYHFFELFNNLDPAVHFFGLHDAICLFWETVAVAVSVFFLLPRELFDFLGLEDEFFYSVFDWPCDMAEDIMETPLRLPAATGRWPELLIPFLDVETTPCFCFYFFTRLLDAWAEASSSIRVNSSMNSWRSLS